MASTTANGTADVLAAARRYMARGFRVVPVVYRTKKCVLDDWPGLRIAEEELPAYFPNRSNLGLLTGDPSDGQVDADLDCREARAAAPFILPPTGLVGGRESAADSHWWYRVDRPPESEKFFDPTVPEQDKRGLLLELRSSGLQTVVYPSVYPAEPDKGHPADERAVWSKEGEPARVSAADLTAAVRAIAAASLLGRHLGPSRRHDPTLALAGGLLRAGWSVEKVEVFVLAAAAASGGGDPKNLTQAVRDTAEKLEAGDKEVTGWPKLAKLLGSHGDTLVGQIREWLNITTTSGPRIVFGSGGKPAAPRYVPIPEFKPFPTDALPQPWRDLTREGARSVGCDESYLAVPALAVAAGAIGNSRRVYLGRNWSEPAVVWGCLVGDSSALKSPALTLVTDPIRDRQQQLVEEYQTERKQYEAELAQWMEDKKAHRRGEGDDPGEKPEEPILKRLYCSDTTIERLADLLYDNPRGLLVVRDELAGWFGSFGRYKARGAGSDLPHWLEFHRAGPVTVDRKSGDRKFTFVPRAAVSVVGGIQPHILAAQLTPEFMACGLTARLLFTMPPSRPKVWTEDAVSEDTLGAVGRNLDAMYGLGLETDDKGRSRPVVVGLSTAAKREWVAFYNQWGQRQAAAEGEVAAAFGKIEAYAARFALIHHVTTRAEDLCDTDSIGPESIDAGVTLARWFAGEAERVYRMLGESAEETDVRRLVEQVLRHGGRITARKLAKSNRRKFRDADAAEVALTQLVGYDLGAWEDMPPGPSGGRPTKTFVLKTADGETGETDAEDDSDGGDEAPPPDGKTPDRPTSPPPSPAADTDGTPCGDRESGETGASDDEVTPVSPSAVHDDQRVERQPARVTTPAEGSAVPSEVTPSGYTLITDADGVAHVAAVIEDHGGPVGLDTETTGLDWLRNDVRLIQVSTGPDTFVIDVNRFPDSRRDFARLFEALAGVEVIAHNAQFDLRFLRKHQFTPGRVFCTQLASQVLHAGGPGTNVRGFHTLREVAARELNRTLDKSEQDGDWSAEELTDRQLRYAVEDAAVLPDLASALRAKLDAAGLSAAADLEMRALPGIAFSWPVSVDVDRWDDLAKQAETERDRLAGELDRLAPAQSLTGTREWGRTAQVVEAFRSVGVDLTDTKDETLATIDHPLAEVLRQYRSASKRAGSYGKEWAKKHIRFRYVVPSWRQLGTATGRMSCNAPNLQQLPKGREYREGIVAGEGRVVIKADFSQIELRIAAKITGDDAMMAAYRDGADIHTLTAAAVTGKPAAEVTKADRQVAKALNFGLIYGCGSDRLRASALTDYGVRLTDDQAREYRAKFFKTYKGLAAWHRKVGNLAKSKGVDTRTLTGRRRVGVVPFTERLNSPVQGTGADGLKAAIAQLWERRSECPDVRLILFVHDEIVLTAPTAQAQQAAGWLKAAMVDGMAPLIDPVPVEVDVSIGRTWGGD